MTTRELIQQVDRQPWIPLAVLLATPVAAGLLGRLKGQDGGGQAPWKYFYAVLVYLACVPGIFAAVVTAYLLFFSRENLLDLSLLVSGLPIASMIVTLVLIRNSVSFDLVPGFDRLSGLMVMLGCSFALALALHKMNIWIIFGGPIAALFVLAAGTFVLLKGGMYMLFRRRDEPKPEPPKFPGV
jgi:hypothetical protein